MNALRQKGLVGYVENDDIGNPGAQTGSSYACAAMLDNSFTEHRISQECVATSK